MTDKIEGVKQVSEVLSKQSPGESIESFSSHKEQFESLMDSTQSGKAFPFERVDPNSAFVSEEVQSPEEKPVFAEENVSSQKNGSATDQERKGRQQHTNEIEEVSAARPSGKNSSKSIMQEVNKINNNVSDIVNLSPEKIKAQAKSVVSQIENVKTQLSQMQTEIKPSYQALLRNRLTHIDDNLKIALNKAGIEYTPPASQVTNQGKTNPIQTFIGYLTNSQQHISELGGTIEQLNDKKISPAKMLAIQLKMNYIQQNVELFANLLNKALESTKTIMNVQV